MRNKNCEPEACEDCSIENRIVKSYKFEVITIEDCKIFCRFSLDVGSYNFPFKLQNEYFSKSEVHAKEIVWVLILTSA